MALLKVQSSQTMEFCAREAMQIFGGKGYIEGGRGAKVSLNFLFSNKLFYDVEFFFYSLPKREKKYPKKWTTFFIFRNFHCRV